MATIYAEGHDHVQDGSTAATRLGVSFVASEMQKYKDAVLFGLTMAWGVEIQSFHLLRDHSRVNFAMLKVLKDVEGEAMRPQQRTQATKRGQNPRREAQASRRKGAHARG